MTITNHPILSRNPLLPVGPSIAIHNLKDRFANVPLFGQKNTNPSVLHDIVIFHRSLFSFLPWFFLTFSRNIPYNSVM